MPQYVAFLRAIYHQKMAPLRRSFEEMGFSSVDSFLASGNIIFEATSENPAALEQQIEKALPETLGHEVAAFIRSTDEVTDVSEYKPFEGAEMEAEGNTLYVGFLKDAPGEDAQQKLMTYATDDDALHLDGREVYWLCRTKASDSKFSGAVVERTLDMQATMRNVRTVNRITAKYF